MVNTLPPQSGDRRAEVSVIVRHATDVLPEVFGPEQPARVMKGQRTVKRAALVRFPFPGAGVRIDTYE
jgi:hypothetical protein